MFHNASLHFFFIKKMLQYFRGIFFSLKKMFWKREIVFEGKTGKGLGCISLLMNKAPKWGGERFAETNDSEDGVKIANFSFIFSEFVDVYRENNIAQNFRLHFEEFINILTGGKFYIYFCLSRGKKCKISR